MQRIERCPSAPRCTLNMLLSRGGLPYVNDAVGRGPLSVIPAKAGNQPAVSRRPERLLDSRLRGNDERGGGNTSQFVYGADGLRRRTSSVNGSTVHYVLDGSMPIRELTDALLNKATYLIGPRGPEYRRDDTTGTIRWYCYDGLGSVLAEVDPLGNLTATRKYDVYGSVRSSQDTSPSKHEFSVCAAGLCSWPSPYPLPRPSFARCGTPFARERAIVREPPR